MGFGGLGRLVLRGREDCGGEDGSHWGSSTCTNGDLKRIRGGGAPVRQDPVIKYVPIHAGRSERHPITLSEHGQ